MTLIRVVGAISSDDKLFGFKAFINRSEIVAHITLFGMKLPITMPPYVSILFFCQYTGHFFQSKIFTFVFDIQFIFLSFY